MNIVSFDIETVGGHFEASYGRILCMSYVYNHAPDKVYTIHARTLKDELQALKDIASVVRDADILVSWNGKMFDFPFIQARMFQRLKKMIPKEKHLDLYHVARHHFKLRGYRLDFFAKDMRMEHQKYEVPAWRWVQAMESETYPKSYKEIVKHCEQDVRMTNEALELLRPFIVRVNK